jgi:glucose/arabinose dehydrogenase
MSYVASRAAAVRAAAVLLCLGRSVPAGAGAPPAGFTETVVFSGLTNPTTVRFSPDGRVFVAQKNGLIKVFDDLSDTSATTVIDLSMVVQDYWDRGLLGFTLHPNFPATPYLYVLYTYDYDPASPSTFPRWGDTCPDNPGGTADGCVVNGRLSRIEVTPNNTVVGGENVLIENQWCQQFPSHSIGGLAFGAEGALYASAGDGASFNTPDWGQFGGTRVPVKTPPNPCGDPNRPRGTATVKPGAEGGALRSQDVRSAADAFGLNGALLRIDPITGAAWPTNPLVGGAVGDDRIVAYGLRNPFRIAHRPGTNEIWVGDVGWSTWEEVDRVVDAGGPVENFGWPCYEGSPRQADYDGSNLTMCENLYTTGDTNVVAPYFAYLHQQAMYTGDTCGTGSSSTSGLAFYTAGAYPAAYNGALFFADYSRDCIFVMYRGANGNPDPATRTAFVKIGGSPSAEPNAVDLQIGPGGDLYYADLDGGKIRRIQYVTGNQPPTAQILATPSSGPVPLHVQFNGAGSTDPNPGATLYYDWDLDGDGQYDDSSIANPSRDYLSPGDVHVGLLVTDDDGATDTETFTISVGNTAPTATIVTPTAADTWTVGQILAFSGGATDPTDGTLPASALRWELVLYHCPGGTTECHGHGLETFDDVASGQFTAPDHEYYSYLELRLVATDSGGLTGEDSVILAPRLVMLSYETDPPGLEVGVAGADHASPFSELAIIGSSVPLSAASPQTMDGNEYYWVSWDDGGGQAHTLIPGELPVTLTASFAACVAVEADCDGQDEDCNGTADDVPVPGAATSLDVSPTEIAWSPIAGAASYDVVRGSLSKLQPPPPGEEQEPPRAGDFATATEGCVVSALGGTAYAYAIDPPPDEGYWFLVRGRSCGGTGTFDGGPPQLGSRDAGIAASGASCP